LSKSRQSSIWYQYSSIYAEECHEILRINIIHHLATDDFTSIFPLSPYPDIFFTRNRNQTSSFLHEKSFFKYFLTEIGWFGLFIFYIFQVNFSSINLKTFFFREKIHRTPLPLQLPLKSCKVVTYSPRFLRKLYIFLTFDTFVYENKLAQSYFWSKI
jgi:hypothetical protein